MKLKTVMLFCLLVLFLCIILTGCSPQERSGISRIPQNRPASWEVNPMSR